MRPLSDALLSHYQQPLTTLTRCARIERQDGVVLGLTEHDQDFLFEDTLYRSIACYQSSAVQLAANLAVGTVEIEGILQAAGVVRQEIVAGLFDHAQIELFEVNYANLSQGKLILLCGYWGETQLQGNRFITEFRSLAQTLQQPVGECYSPTCRAQLGDARCSIDLSLFTHRAVVKEVISSIQMKAADLMQADNYFTEGQLVWESGANQNLSTAIRCFQTGGRFLFTEPLPYPIQVGDTFLATTGCDKRLDTCVTKFHNAINFRGEPFVSEREDAQAP